MEFRQRRNNEDGRNVIYIERKKRTFLSKKEGDLKKGTQNSKRKGEQT